jgi:protein subunit release factor A
MGEALKHFHPEDIEVTETRVGRKHEVTAIHKPTGISVIKDGLSFQITRKQALETLENRLTEEYEEEAEEDQE